MHACEYQCLLAPTELQQKGVKQAHLCNVVHGVWQQGEQVRLAGHHQDVLGGPVLAALLLCPREQAAALKGGGR